MGYPTDTIKLVYGGKAGPDIWRSSVDLVAILTAGPPDNADMTLILNQLNDSVDTLWTFLKTKNAAVLDYSFNAAYFYPAGSNTATSLAVNEFTGVAGTSALTKLPVTTAIAIEKRTDQAGRRNRGRAYLPMTQPGALTNNLQFGASEVTAVVAAYETFLSTLEGLSPTGGLLDAVIPVVTSPTRTALPQRISYLQADSIPDVQRRRKSEAVPDSVVTQTIEV